MKKLNHVDLLIKDVISNPSNWKADRGNFWNTKGISIWIGSRVMFYNYSENSKITSHWSLKDKIKFGKAYKNWINTYWINQVLD